MKINSSFFKIIEKYQHLPFVWGENDCALFCASILNEYIGIDFGADVRGTYSDEYHGMRKIVEMGGWETILTGRGFTKLENKNLLSRGDIVVSENALGIWVGNYAIFAGNVHRNLSTITEVYRY